MNKWEPTPKQAKFLALPLTILEGFYAGAVMAGKSDVLLAYPLVHKWHELEGFKGVYFRRTFPELQNEIVPRSKKIYPKFGATYNKSEKEWTFPSGAIIRFGHCENEDDVHKYDSMEINYAAFDELTSFTQWQYEYIVKQRVRKTIGSNLPAVCRAASNPGNIGHTWVKKHFIDPCPSGHVIIQGPTGVKRIYIPATVYDNPHADPAYIRQLESLPEAERQSKLLGKWDAYEGQVFEEFRDKNYPDEPSHACHVVEKFEPPSFWPKIVSIDWGYTPPAMTLVLFGAIAPDGRVYIYRELAYQKKKIAEWTPEVKEYIDKEEPRKIKLCKSAGQERGQEHTIQSEIETGLGTSVELTSNLPGSRVAGKMLLHEYLRWKPKYSPQLERTPFSSERAEWLFRNRPIGEYNNYIDSFRPPEPEILPKLFMTGSCKHLINAIKSCSYQKTNINGMRPEDVSEFPGDDAYDACRYLLDECDRFVNTSKVEFSRVQQQQELMRQFEQTQDMTSFYRNARAMEQKMVRKLVAVPRYPHGRRVHA